MTIRLLASTAGLALLASQAAADFTLTILHTNDFHDRFEAINGSNSTCGEEDAAANECFGGIARLCTAVAEARERAGEQRGAARRGRPVPGLALLPAVQGRRRGRVHERSGYDAMAVGNHEFDDGPQGLRDFLDQVEFPVLSANIDVSREPILAEQVQKSRCSRWAASRIGIVSVLPRTRPRPPRPART
jgi:5'-nucleotidase